MRVSPGLTIILCTVLLVCINLLGLYQRLDYIRRTPPPSPARTSEVFVLSFVGDIMAHDVNYLNPSYEEIYRGVGPFLQQDLLSFGNLEFPVDASKPLQNYPRFNVHPSYVDAAVDAGFQVFSAANNHSADQGPESILATAEYLDILRSEKETRWSGLRHHADDPLLPELIEAEGMRIGFLAVTAFLNMDEGSALVNRIDYADPERRESFLNYISEIRKLYDLFILSVHGGVEYATLPGRGKHAFFHELIEAGVDIVWGHHPHVLQPWEMVLRHDGRQALIINSAGNFISGQTWHMTPDEVHTEIPSRGEGAIYRVNLVHSPERGASIRGVSAVPVISYRDPGRGMVLASYTELITDEKMDPLWKQFYSLREEPLQDLLEPFSWRNLTR
ncbi:hypothetical protein B4O97_04595 [Marispirochaeta aestuarii]|uniref:Capsule synthesis protein CapA domain-containing protein n=1 Tax=Marispirochaeta aestuarii TaxID=1963862 RepID=A0A1Y1S1U1_9SPIO|nr:CapA family protein [Marispirochaeta aestuarii]ORC36908.1 hypothetical protein B4O97_04595 [Marispirochaeta aestuarii]